MKNNPFKTVLAIILVPSLLLLLYIIYKAWKQNQDNKNPKMGLLGSLMGQGKLKENEEHNNKVKEYNQNQYKDEQPTAYHRTIADTIYKLTNKAFISNSTEDLVWNKLKPLTNKDTSFVIQEFGTRSYENRWDRVPFSDNTETLNSMVSNYFDSKRQTTKNIINKLQEALK